MFKKSYIQEALGSSKFGFRALVDTLHNQSLRWSEDFGGQKRGDSSLSEQDPYSSFVEKASRDELYFKKFRSNEDYLRILDHVSYAQGRDYLSLLETKYLDWLTQHEELQHQFAYVGLPQTFRFRLPSGQIRRQSPSLLRYLKVSQDIQKFFGELDGHQVVEIGVGFGGQSLVCNWLNGVVNFHYFDLPSVLDLTQKFCSKFPNTLKPKYLDGRHPKRVVADLVISNYAYSELTLSVQEKYFDEVISGASRGYITWNRLSETFLDGMTAEHFASKIAGAEILEETPNTHPGNCLIVWGR